MSQQFDKDKATTAYAHLMELIRVRAYRERNPNGSYSSDGIEECLELLDLNAAALGLCLRWNDKTTLWTLETMNEKEKAAFNDALRDFAAQEQQTISTHKADPQFTKEMI